MQTVLLQMMRIAWMKWLIDVEDGKVNNACPCCRANMPGQGYSTDRVLFGLNLSSDNYRSSVQVAFGVNPDREYTPPIDEEEFDHEPTEVVDPDDIETGDVISEDSTQYDTCWIPELVTRQEADYLLSLHPNHFYVREPSRIPIGEDREEFYFDQYELSYLGPTNARYQIADQNFVIQVMEELLEFRINNNTPSIQRLADEQTIQNLRENRDLYLISTAPRDDLVYSRQVYSMDSDQNQDEEFSDSWC